MYKVMPPAKEVITNIPIMPNRLIPPANIAGAAAGLAAIPA